MARLAIGDVHPQRAQEHHQEEPREERAAHGRHAEARDQQKDRDRYAPAATDNDQEREQSGGDPAPHVPLPSHTRVRSGAPVRGSRDARRRTRLIVAALPSFPW